jgi:hypothetical protein
MNKLGFYTKNFGAPGVVDAIKDLGPPVLLTELDDKGALREIRGNWSPHTFIVGRFYLTLQQQNDMLDSPDPAKKGVALAEQCIEHDFHFSKQKIDDRLIIDAWMSLNEAVRGPNSFPEGHDHNAADYQEMVRRAEAYDILQVAFLERLRQEGLEAVAFNFAAGNWTRGEDYIKYFPRTLAAYMYLGFHEYGWPYMNPEEPDTSSGCGIYREVMEVIRREYGDTHEVIITEAGLARMYKHPKDAVGDVGWLYQGEDAVTEEIYKKSLRWYNRHLADDDYVIGACLFQVGTGSGWETFSHTGHDHEGRAITLMDELKAIAQEEVPVPRALELPATVALSGTVLGAAANPVAGVSVRLIGSQATAGTARDAACVNPMAVTWTLQLSGFSGNRWQCWKRFVAPGVAGISWPEFREKVLVYNPSLARSGHLFQADQAYVLPQKGHIAPQIVWDRPLTGFSGDRWACWEQYVQNKVVGLSWPDFATQVVTHNAPDLAGDGNLFTADKTYQLPRNEGQEEYEIVAYSGSTGHYSFANIPVGEYRLEVRADGYRPLVQTVDLTQSQPLDLKLKPMARRRRRRAPRDLAVDFFEVHDGQFFLGDQPFKFVGMNIRGLIHYGDQYIQGLRDNSHPGDRNIQLQAAKQMGARVVRSFLANKFLTPEQVAERLREVMVLFNSEQFRDMYLIPVLTDMYSDSNFSVQGDDHFYRSIRPGEKSILPREFFEEGYKDHYLPFVEHIVNAFKDEPHIFAWEIGNELKCEPVNTADPADNPDVLVKFLKTVAGKIRGWDKNHLITTGLISTRQAWLGHRPDLQEALYTSPNIDFITVHAYPYPKDSSQLREDDSHVATMANKPFVVEEAGFDPKYHPDRILSTADEMQRLFGLGASGYMPWGFMATPHDNGDGDRVIGIDRLWHGNDWDGLSHLLQQHAQALLSA